MNFDPKFTFWLGVVTVFMQGVLQGSVHLTDLVPPDFVKPVTAYLGLFSLFNVTLLTAMSGLSSAKTGPLAPPPTVKEAQDVLKQAQDAAK